MKKMKNNNRERAKAAKIFEQPWEDYYCERSFKMKPACEATLERFALGWINEVMTNPRCIEIWNYPYWKAGISDATVYLWMKRSEMVKRAHAFVKRMCALKRDEGAAFKEMDGSFIARSMSLYSDEWRKMMQEADEFKAELAQKIAEKSGGTGTKFIIMEKFEDSPLVPKKKEIE